MTRRLLPLLALALALSGCTTSGADEQTRSAGAAGYVGVSGQVTTIAPADREVLPESHGPELGGERTLSTRGHGDRVVVVNVWGSWCNPCRKEAPDLQAASVATKGRAQFLGINTRDRDPGSAEAFVRAQGITYPSIYDPDGAALLPFSAVLPPSGVPSTLVIDGQGRLAVRVLGPISEGTLVDMIDGVAAGQ